jgi:2-oxoglutarate ferredoxin oxidoreductase subunit beta
MAPCPTAYGRRNKLGDIKKHWDWYDENTILIEDYNRIMEYGTDNEKNEIRYKFPIGVFQDLQKPGFFEQYEKLVERLIPKKEKKTEAKVVINK